MKTIPRVCSGLDRLPRRIRMKRRHAFVCIALAVLVSSCIVTRVQVELLDPGDAAETYVKSSFKAFLTDGRVAVFQDGGHVTADSIFGLGTLYSLDLANFIGINALALDDVIGLESVRGRVDFGRSVFKNITTVASIPVVLIGAITITCIWDPKCFGSCPTVYSYDDTGEVLEAETFSYSIAPLLEARDVDRIRVVPDANGVVKLEVRNEALETHYINHLAILEVRHEADQAAYPNEEGHILVVGDLTGATSAIDRDGSDRLGELSARDGMAFYSSDQRIRAVTAEDFRDYIELTFPRPDSESAALVLRHRNSLLNTILFYDLMLASQGAGALDWLAADMANIGKVVELDQWVRKIMGLEISVQSPAGWERVTRLRDTGPLAWDEVAIQVPVPEGDELRVRLSFLADEWRIDFAGLAEEVQFVDPTEASFVHVAPIDEAPDPDLADRIAQPDEDYLVTIPSVALSLESAPLGAWSDDKRSFFLSSQGYYTEWIRPEWIRTADPPEKFQPSGETLVRLIGRWLEEKDEFQRSFFETRIPVR